MHHVPSGFYMGHTGELQGLCAGYISFAFSSSAVVPVSFSWPPSNLHCFTCTICVGIGTHTGGWCGWPCTTIFTTHTRSWNSPVVVSSDNPWRTSTPGCILAPRIYIRYLAEVPIIQFSMLLVSPQQDGIPTITIHYCCGSLEFCRVAE
jgi:hypothetical protein